jgi:hypothetical protein
MSELNITFLADGYRQPTSRLMVRQVRQEAGCYNDAALRAREDRITHHQYLEIRNLHDRIIGENRGIDSTEYASAHTVDELERLREMCGALGVEIARMEDVVLNDEPTAANGDAFLRVDTDATPDATTINWNPVNLAADANVNTWTVQDHGGPDFRRADALVATNNGFQVTFGQDGNNIMIKLRDNEDVKKLAGVYKAMLDRFGIEYDEFNNV